MILWSTMAFTVFTLLIIFFGSCAGVRNPGFKARITQNGLTYATTVAIQELTKNVNGKTIPDQTGDSGHVHYELNSMTIRSFTAPRSAVTVKSGTGLQWSASGTGIGLKGDFRYKYKKGWVKISDHGSFDLSVSNLNFNVVIMIGMGTGGRPKINSGSCNSSIGSVHIDFHGGASWIYNLFKGFVEGKIKGAFGDQMCSILQKFINTNAEQALSKLKVMVDIAHTFMLDYRFISAPLYKGTVMETYHKGEVYWIKDQTEAPFAAPSMPQSGDSSRMFYLWISDYLFNSMSYVAQKHGMLAYNMTRKDLPPDNNGYLNSTCKTGTCIGRFIPAIGKKYPGSTVELALASTVAPLMNTSGQIIAVNCTGEINFYARLPKGDRYYLLTMGATMTSVVNVSLSKQNIYAGVDSLKVKVHVTKSSIGKVSGERKNNQPPLCTGTEKSNPRVKDLQHPRLGKLRGGLQIFDTRDGALQFLTNSIINEFVTPKLNDLGKRGFPLPVTDKVHFTNTQLSLKQDTLMIGTDLKYY